MHSSRSPLRSPLLLLIASALLLLPILGVHGSPLMYGSRYDVLERRGCGTHIDLDARAEMEDGLLRIRSEGTWQDSMELDARDDKKDDKKGKAERTMKPVSFDVYWHVVYANETKQGGYVTDEQIQNQMNVLNTDYKSTNISWTLKNITRIQSEDWFMNVWPGSEQEKEMKKMYHKGDSSVLNIFTAQFNSTTKSLGFASLPSAYLRDPLSDGLIIRHSTLPGGDQENYNHGRTTVHEAGHWLGLYHTFEGGCEGVGDNIDDTAPEASESVGCPVGRKSCPGSKLEDPIHNFMDYSYDTCMTHFTPGQAKRMHEVIWAFRTKRPPGPSSPSASASAAASTSSSTTSTSASASATSTSTPESGAASTPVSAALTAPPASDPNSQDSAPEEGQDGVVRSWDHEDDEFERGWQVDDEGDVERGWDDGGDDMQERLWDDEDEY